MPLGKETWIRVDSGEPSDLFVLLETSPSRSAGHDSVTDICHSELEVSQLLRRDYSLALFFPRSNERKRGLAWCDPDALAVCRLRAGPARALCCLHRGGGGGGRA